MISYCTAVFFDNNIIYCKYKYWDDVINEILDNKLFNVDITRTFKKDIEVCIF